MPPRHSPDKSTLHRHDNCLLPFRRRGSGAGARRARGRVSPPARSPIARSAGEEAPRTQPSAPPTNAAPAPSASVQSAGCSWTRPYAPSPPRGVRQSNTDERANQRLRRVSVQAGPQSSSFARQGGDSGGDQQQLIEGSRRDARHRQPARSPFAPLRTSTCWKPFSSTNSC